MAKRIKRSLRSPRKYPKGISATATTSTVLSTVRRAVRIKSVKKRIVERVAQEPYLVPMQDKRNKEYGDFEEMWANIPIVLVASINGSVTNIFPYEEVEHDIDENIALRVAHEGQVNGALFDMYLNGYFYPIAFNQRELNRIMQARRTGKDIFTEVMQGRIKEIRELHHAFYFPDEVSVDTDAQA